MYIHEKKNALEDRFGDVFKQDAFLKTVRIDVGVGHCVEWDYYVLDVGIRKILNGRVDNRAEYQKLEFLPTLLVDALLNATDKDFRRVCTSYYHIWKYYCKPQYLDGGIHVDE